MTVQRIYTVMQTHISPFIEQPELDLLLIFWTVHLAHLVPSRK